MRRHILRTEGNILCTEGDLDVAMEALSDSDRAAIIPSHNCYLSIIKTCVKKKSVHHTKRVYDHIIHHKVTICGSLGDHLVMALAKCGLFDDACHVFYGLSDPSVFSWTALISGYVDHGRSSDALLLYYHGIHMNERMTGGELQPNHYTFVSLLKACRSLSDIENGRKLHDDIKTMGFLSNVYVGNTLVSMYGKCGDVIEAENVFLVGMPRFDPASWNVMLSVYVERGEDKKSLLLYRQMEEEGVSPDERTLVTVLQACINLNKNNDLRNIKEHGDEDMALDIGQALHSEVRRRGFSSYVFFVTALICMYGKCRQVHWTENVFSAMLYPDVIMWNSMLTAYSDCGYGVKALQAYVEMQKQRTFPDQHTFVISLQACRMLEESGNWNLGKSSLLEIGEALFLDAYRLGFAYNDFIDNTLISLYGICGNIVKAEEIFRRMHDRKDVSWNAMMSAYVEHGEGAKALRLYSQMEKESTYPNTVTYVVACQACCALLDVAISSSEERLWRISVEIGRALHIDMHPKGLVSDVVIGSILVHMYGKCGMILQAELVFNGLTYQNVVTWNAMLSAYVEEGQLEIALDLFRKMLEEGVVLDSVTLVGVLQASGLACQADSCWEAHFFLTSTNFQLTPLLATTLINAYGNCALLSDAQRVFHALVLVDSVSWSATIDAFVQASECVMSLQTFENMCSAGFEPDNVTFFSVLSACSHAGLIDIGVNCFESMRKYFGPKPDLKHYAIMIDLLGRAGAFTKVEKLLERMPIPPNLEIWLSLLGVCHIHKHVEMGKHAFDQVIQHWPDEVTPYILMSNIYADAGMIKISKELNLIATQRNICQGCFADF